MRKILSVTLFVFFISPVFCQYTVTKVIGSVKNKTTNELLKPGSTFKDTSTLNFSTNKDMVRAVVAGEGVYIITPSTKAEKQGNNLLEIVKFALHIKSKEGNLSGRGENSELIPETLGTENRVNTKNVIMDENRYLFDPAVYNVSAGNKFFLQTETAGLKPAIKSLETYGDTLVIYISDFKVDAEQSNENVKYKLGFYSKENKASSLLTQIYPYFDSTGEMDTIIKIIIADAGEKDKEKIQEQCYQEIYETMGKPADIIFKNAFNKIYASYAQAAINAK